MNKQVNLLPDSYVVRAWAREVARLWLIVAAGAVCIFVLTLAHFERRARRVESDVKPLRLRAEQMEEQTARLQGLLRGLRDARAREVQAHQHQLAFGDLAREPFWSGALAEVAAASSDGLWITDLELRASERRAGGGLAASAPPARISVSGQAVSSSEVAAFISRLGQSGSFSHFDLQDSEALSGAKDTTAVEFEAAGGMR